MLDLAFAGSEEAVESMPVGEKLLEQRNVEATIREFEKPTVIDPKYGAAQLNLGYAYGYL